jgi:hypothetical protein
MADTIYTFCGFDFTTDYMTMLSSIFTGLTTLLFIRESYLMRKYQNMPEISMYLKFAEASPALLFLIIENIGNGVARNVKFDIVKNYEHYKNPDDNLTEIGIIKNGLENFYPKQIFRYFINHTSENWEEKKEQIIKIKVSYDDFFFTRTNKTYVMSVEQFAGGRQFKPGDTFPSHIASSMEQIQKDISKLRESFENSIK